MVVLMVLCITQLTNGIKCNSTGFPITSVGLPTITTVFHTYSAE
ncbi:MAG: hypothetical protein ACQEU4_08845 [Bacillota bacterium]